MYWISTTGFDWKDPLIRRMHFLGDVFAGQNRYFEFSTLYLVG